MKNSKNEKPVLYNPYKNRSNRRTLSSSLVDNTKVNPGQNIASQIENIKISKKSKTLKNARIQKKRSRLSSVSSKNILEEDSYD